MLVEDEDTVETADRCAGQSRDGDLARNRMSIDSAMLTRVSLASPARTSATASNPAAAKFRRAWATLSASISVPMNRPEPWSRRAEARYIAETPNDVPNSTTREAFFALVIWYRNSPSSGEMAIGACLKSCVLKATSKGFLMSL